MKIQIKTIFSSIVLSALLAGCNSKPTSEMDAFIDDLMGKMTLEEKIGQLNLPVTGEIVTGQAKSSNVAKQISEGKVGGLFNLKGADRIREMQELAVNNSRLGIPLLFGMDVIHGYETVFPIPLALSCSWNMETIEKTARMAAIEASEGGICWTFSPMVDISRDPRWGRVAEGSGEDPYLGGEIARAMVRGYQGDLTRNDEILACVKHFALYGASEAGRDYNTVDMSRIRMYNEYFEPYKAAVEEGAGSVMASFNEIDGIPATGNKWLLTEVLRNQWGFDGFVVTDYTGIYEMIAHGMGDMAEVSKLALEAGVDMDMVSDGFVGTLAQSVAEGKVSEATIDQACRRMLEAKYKLGLFENPYKYCEERKEAPAYSLQERKDFARKAATESFVLLKNEGNLLPLKKQGSVAVIGPLGNTKANMPGTWSVATIMDSAVTVVEGLQRVLGDQVTVRYAKGSNLMSDAAYEQRATMFGRELGRDNRSDEALLNEALQVARQSDVIIATLGEASEMSGECSSRTELNIPDVQRRLLEKLLATGKPVVLVLFAGRPMTLTWEAEHVPAILNAWFGGTETGLALADVLFGDANPSGKLTMTFPKNVGQIPIYYAHKNTGRPLIGPWFEKFKSNYIDIDNEPLYPFGYGLSYTNFSYDNFTLDKAEMGVNDVINAQVTITNTGKYDGAEIVQLYIRDMVGSVTRPVKELKGFQKIFLKAGESRTVNFEINADMLKFYNSDLDFVCEPGDFEVMIGANSRDVESLPFVLK